MGRLLWIGVGAVGALALRENSESVANFVHKTLELIKYASAELTETTVQGKKLGEVPVMKDILQFICSIDVSKDAITAGVFRAKTVTEAVSASLKGAEVAPKKPQGNSMTLWVLLVSSPYFAWVLSSDNRRRQYVIAPALLIYDRVQQFFVHVKKTESGNWIMTQTSAAHQQLLRSGLMIVNYVKDRHPGAVEAAKQFAGFASVEAHKLFARVQSEGPILILKANDLFRRLVLQPTINAFQQTRRAVPPLPPSADEPMVTSAVSKASFTL